MDLSTVDVTVVALVIGAVTLFAVLALAARRARARAMAPVRLGPSWGPEEASAPPPDPAADPRVEILEQRTGIEASTVALVLTAWDEHLAVLGFLSLPAAHRYRVYDPYDPPVARRGPDNRPLADPERVARDVARRTGVDELDARSILDSLLADPEADGPDDQRS